MSFADMIVKTFNGLSPNLDNIYNDAYIFTLSEWEVSQTALATSSGALASSIPGAHLIALAGDVTFLMNRMSVCSYGIGAIMGYDNNLGNILEHEDFAIVLAIWAGDNKVITILEGLEAKSEDVLEAMEVKVGTKTGVKFVAKKVVKKAGLLIGKKLGGKIGAKIGAKFAGKLSGKILGGFIPVGSSAIGGGINWWFMSGISEAAKHYYEIKVKILQQ